MLLTSTCKCIAWLHIDINMQLLYIHDVHVGTDIVSDKISGYNFNVWIDFGTNTLAFEIVYCALDDN